MKTPYSKAVYDLFLSLKHPINKSSFIGLALIQIGGDEQAVETEVHALLDACGPFDDKGLVHSDFMKKPLPEPDSEAAEGDEYAPAYTAEPGITQRVVDAINELPAGEYTDMELLRFLFKRLPKDSGDSIWSGCRNARRIEKFSKQIRVGVTDKKRWTWGPKK